MTTPVTPGATLAAIAVLLLVIGCTDERPRPRSSETDDAFATLSSLEYDYVSQAAANLALVDYERTMETVQYDAAGDTSAYEWIRVEYRNGVPRIVDSLNHGRFRTGVLGRWFGPRPGRPPDSSTFPSIVQADPAYLSARNRDAYDFQTTRFAGLPAIEVRLRDADDVESDLQRAVLAYEPRTGQVVVMEIERRGESLLLGTQSEAALTLTQAVDSLWLPSSFSFSQTRNTPLQRPYNVRKTATYGQFRAR